MKKIFTFCTFTFAAVVSLFAQDVIVTTDAKKIDAKITEVTKNEVRYKDWDNQDGPTFILEVADINSIIYSNGKVVLYGDDKKSGIENTQLISNADENTIEILLLSGEKITAQVKELTDEILYFTVDGEYRTMAASRVEKVTYLQSGQVKQYNTKTISTENVSVSNKKELNLARANNYSGVYIFTDCTPVAEYEVLGDVYFDKEGKVHASTLPYYNAQSKTINTIGYTYKETPQYTDIRDALIAQSVMANRQVEGILISIPKEGEGRATLIKFKEGATNKDLARANSHLGVFVFTDCMPINTYTFVGKISGAGGLSSDYNNLRDRLIKKAQKKYSTVQGVITRLVSGGRDSVEAIRF